MGERTDEIREEIEGTRGEMGDTVDALAYKADVKTRARDAISERKDRLVSRVSGATPDREQVKGQTQRVKGQTQRVKEMGEQNPLGLGVAGAAVGFLAGLLFPSTQTEDQRLGQVSDQVKEQAKDAGQEALDRGKQVAQEAAQTAKETAKERSREQQQEMTESLRSRAQETQQETTG